jgi:hypothetical protein
MADKDTIEAVLDTKELEDLLPPEKPEGVPITDLTTLQVEDIIEKLKARENYGGYHGIAKDIGCKHSQVKLVAKEVKKKIKELTLATQIQTKVKKIK